MNRRGMDWKQWIVNAVAIGLPLLLAVVGHSLRSHGVF